MKLYITNKTSNNISTPLGLVTVGATISGDVLDANVSQVTAQLKLLGSKISYRFDNAGIVIDQATILNVALTGSDSDADGSSVKPYRTIQAALDSLTNVVIKAPVTVSVGPGTFNGFYMPNFTIAQPVGSATASVTVLGTVSNSAIVGTCVASIVAGTTILTDVTKTWTVDEHVGKLVTCIDGGGSTFQFMIYGNSATELYLTTNSIGYISYTINSLDTILTPINMNTNTCSILLPVGGYQAQVGQVVLRYLRNQSTSSPAISLRGGNVQVTWCCFSSTASVVNIFSGVLSTTSTVFTGSGTGINVLSTSSAGTVLLNSTAFSKLTTGMSLISPSVYVQFGGNCIFYKNTTGLSALNGSTLYGIGVVMKFQDCITGASLSQKTSLATMSGLFGTGNTTCFNISKGATLQILATSTITGTTELNVDGTTGTIATMRGNSPKVFPLTPNAYGSYAYE